MTVTCPVNDTIGICTTLDSAGAGIGVLLQYLGQSLPYFLILLAIVGLVVGLGYAITSVIKGSISGRHYHR